MTTAAATDQLPPPRQHVPLDLDGGVIHERHKATMTAGSLGESFLRTAVGLLDTFSSTLNQAHEARRAVVATATGVKPTRNGLVAAADPRVEEQLAKALKQSFDRTATLAGTKRSALMEARGRIALRIEEALKWGKTDHASVALATEVRGVLRKMSQTGRQQFLRELSQTADVQTISAVLAAPAFLSGLSFEEKNQFYDDAATTLAPDDRAQLLAADAILDHLERASLSWAKHMGSVHPRLAPAHRRADDLIATLAAG